MTNKRQIKKYIDRIGMDVAQVILPAAVYSKAITDSNAEEILNEISALREQAISRLGISYDKAPESFDSMRRYHAEKARYYREAYGKAVSDFEKGVDEILRTINEARSNK